MGRLLTLLIVLGLVVWALRKWSRSLRASSLGELQAGELQGLTEQARQSEGTKRALAVRARVIQRILQKPAVSEDDGKAVQHIDLALRALAKAIASKTIARRVEDELLDALEGLEQAVKKDQSTERALLRLQAIVSALTSSAPPAP